MNFKYAVLIFPVLLYLPIEKVVARPGAQSCPIGQTITKTFTSGAGWELCWDEKQKEGVVLTNILYSTPGNSSRRVLGEASLSQIQTDYDDGTAKIFWVTGVGLGGNSQVNLSASDCSGGQRLQKNGKNVLCQTTKPMGYVWAKGNQQKQGEFLELTSISKFNSVSFVVSWRFYDNGIIEPSVGISGKLTKFTSNFQYGWNVNANNQVAASFTNHYFWRLDFDLEAVSSDDIVEQIVSLPSADRLKKSKQITPIQTEAALSLNPQNKLFWRVRDGFVQNSSSGYVSYELVLLNYAHQSDGNNNESWLNNDFFVTRYNTCERYAVNNPTQNGCAANISQFVNGQNVNQKDVVAWYRASYHHLPRDEDFGQVGTRWTGFKLLPRDWSSDNPL